jgi:apolipoprotein N-acyltransferase
MPSPRPVLFVTPLLARWAATLASAVLFGLSFPPASIRPLAWVALAPFFVAVRCSGPWGALTIAWGWSVLAAYSIGDWMPTAVQTFYLQPAVVGWGLFLAVATSMGAPYYVGFAWLYRRVAAGPPALVPLLAAACWVAAELGRGRLFTGSAFFIGNPWGLIGYSQVGWDPIVQIASTTGVYGIGFAIVATNAGLAEVWIRRGLRGAVMGALLALMPGATALVYGVVSLNGAEDVGPARRVAIVQGNLALGSRWRRDYYGRNLETYLRLTASALRDSRPEVVFWPESAMTFFIEEELSYRRAIVHALGGRQVELVAGAPRREVTPEGNRYYNTIFLIGPDGDIRDRYDKRYLVPFAEYFPFGTLGILRRYFEGARTFRSGDDPKPIATAIGPASVFVCNEGMLPEVVGRDMPDGPSYLLNPSNDTWIPHPRFAEQQLDIVSLRAVEQRRYLVRASTSGPSAIVDPWGRILARTQLDEETVLAGHVRARSGLTRYARVGDAFAFGCLALALSAALGSRPPPQRGPSGRDARPTLVLPPEAGPASGS